MYELIDDDILSGSPLTKLPEIEKSIEEIQNKSNVRIYKIGICGNYKRRFSKYKSHFREQQDISPMARFHPKAAIRPDYMKILYQNNSWDEVAKLEKTLISKYKYRSKNKNPGGEGSKPKKPPYHLYIVAEKREDMNGWDGPKVTIF